jgi:hypothetical protein
VAAIVGGAQPGLKEKTVLSDRTEGQLQGLDVREPGRSSGPVGAAVFIGSGVA